MLCIYVTCELRLSCVIKTLVVPRDARFFASSFLYLAAESLPVWGGLQENQKNHKNIGFFVEFNKHNMFFCGFSGISGLGGSPDSQIPEISPDQKY